MQGNRGGVARPVAAAIAAWVFCTCFAASAPADILHLKNGKQLEGVIQSETDDAVVLNMGMGAITVSRERIDRVERSDAEVNADRQSEWKTRYIRPADLPADLVPVFEDMERLRGTRRGALAAAAALAANEKALVNLHRQVAALHKAIERDREQLAAINPNRERVAYNAMVRVLNEKAATLNQNQVRIQKVQRGLPDHHKRIGRYSRALASFDGEFAAHEAAYAAEAEDAVVRVWLVRTRKELDGFSRDFSRMEIPASRRGGVTEVSVVINGGSPATFILDTGASLVTLTERLARNLGLRFDYDDAIQLSMADGSMAEGYPVVLERVAVGDAVVNQVPAVVMEAAPGPGVEGLLGMTFLKEFEIRFDANKEQLVLQRLETRR